jgi:glycosyltransferase involved in cell wall biosynthesis
VARIGIDYTPAHEQGGGIGRYVRDLSTALAALKDDHTYRLFVAGAQRAPLPPPPAPHFAFAPTNITPRWFARIWNRLHIPLPIEAFVGKVSLYHATDFVLPPSLPNTRTLLTVHDLSFVRVPETASPALKAYLDIVVPRSVRRADHLLADSQATKDDLIALYNTPADKITVLLSGVDPRFERVNDLSQQIAVRTKYNIDHRPYIFAVGTVQPRKNYIRLMQALAALRAQGKDISLVIAGGRGWLEDPIYQAIQDLDLQNHVNFIGFADDSDLPTLYSAALCLAFPSLYEGFGLPILEAMKCGTPVVTANVSSLPEVAGTATLLVDPYDVEALTHALQRIIEDHSLRQHLVTSGYAHAKSFTWERAARQLLSIYNQLLAQ